MTSTGTLLVYI